MAVRQMSLAAFAGATRREDGTLEAKKRKPRSKTIAASSFSKSLEETRAMIEGGDWDGFAARHVVALYDLMHEKCYGTAPVMTSRERHSATLAAGNFIKNHFEGKFAEAVEYFRWLWDREIGRHNWRLENARESNALKFYWTVGGSMLSDYRVHLASEKRRPKGRRA